MKDFFPESLDQKCGCTLYIGVHYTWQNIVRCGVLHLSFFTQHVFKVHSCYNMYQYFGVFNYLLALHCMIMSHFMPHFVLDCVQFGVLTHNAENICKEVFVQTHFYFSWIPIQGILYHMVSLHLTLLLLLFYYSCPNFPHLPFSAQLTPTPTINPHTVVHVHGPFIHVL